MNTVHLYKTDPIYENLALDVFVSDTFNFIIPVFARCLPSVSTHEMYKNYNSSVNIVIVSNLSNLLSNYRVCEGIKNQQVLSFCNQHVVFKEIDSLMNNNKSSENKLYRTPLFILLSLHETFTKCSSFESNNYPEQRRWLQNRVSQI